LSILLLLHFLHAAPEGILVNVVKNEINLCGELLDIVRIYLCPPHALIDIIVIVPNPVGKSIRGRGALKDLKKVRHSHI
jgi:hypothetical protein